MFNNIVRAVALVNVSVWALSLSAFASFNPSSQDDAEDSPSPSESQRVVASPEDFYSQSVLQHERGGLEAKRERPEPAYNSHLERKRHHRPHGALLPLRVIGSLLSPLCHMIS